MLDDSSVVFSSSGVFFLLMCGLRPRLKLLAQMQALMMVMTIKVIVMTAKKVIDGRAGRYSANVAGEYIRYSLKQKYAMAAKKSSCKQWD